MTLERAVQILNEHKHRDTDDWEGQDGDADACADTGTIILCLTAFEAIATAEKYQREAGKMILVKVTYGKAPTHLYLSEEDRLQTEENS